MRGFDQSELLNITFFLKTTIFSVVFAFLVLSTPQENKQMPKLAKIGYFGNFGLKNYQVGQIISWT